MMPQRRVDVHAPDEVLTLSWTHGTVPRAGWAWRGLQGHGTLRGSPCRGLRTQGEESDQHSSFIPMQCGNIFYLPHHALAPTFTLTLSVDDETPLPPPGQGSHRPQRTRTSPGG